MKKITAAQLKKIIREGLEENSQITANYLEQNLEDQTLKEKDFETLSQTINETLYKNKINQGNINDFLDDGMIEKILFSIKPSNQLKIKRGLNKKNFSLSQGNRLMIKMAENMGVQKI